MGFPGGSVGKNPPAKHKTGVQSWGWEDSLEKEMATHFTVLAWEIPRTEEPGRLQSLGSQRVGHDLVTKQQQQVSQDIRLRSFLPHEYFFTEQFSGIRGSKQLPASGMLTCSFIRWEDILVCLKLWLAHFPQLNPKKLFLTWKFTTNIFWDDQKFDSCCFSKQAHLPSWSQVL